MGSIIVHIDSKEDMNLLEELLKRMQFSFEAIPEKKVKVSHAAMKSIKKGLSQANKGELKDSFEIHQKARALCSK